MKTVHNYFAKLGYKLSVATNGLSEAYKEREYAEEEMLHFFHQILVDSIDSHIDLELPEEDMSFEGYRSPSREYQQEQARFIQKLLEETFEEVEVDSCREHNTFGKYPSEENIQRYGTIQSKELFPFTASE